MSTSSSRLVLPPELREVLAAHVRLRARGANGQTIAAIEEAALALLREIGPQVVADALQGVSPDPKAGGVPWCCEAPTQYKGVGTVTKGTLLGPVTLRSAVWWCPRCRRTYRPALDGLELPVSGYTWALNSKVAYLGAWLPSFARAAHALEELTGLVVSARHIQHCTEGMGAAYTLPADRRPARADIVYAEADAVLARFRDQPPWHEVKVFCVWREVDGVSQPPRYWTDEGPWSTHDAALATLARQEGLDQAPVIVTLGDGAAPVWGLLGTLAPHAVQILDWYHLQENVAKVAVHLPDRREWHKLQRTRFHQGAWRAVFGALVTLARTGATEALRDDARRCAGYLFRHRHRLDYPAARARGYPIGSGRIESACKAVVQQRSKGAGMRWGHPGLGAVLHLRCASLNDDWPRALQLWQATGRCIPAWEERLAEAA